MDTNIENENGWVKLTGKAGEMPDVDAWLLRKDGHIFLNKQEEFVGIGEYEYYMPIRKPTKLPNGTK